MNLKLSRARVCDYVGVEMDELTALWQKAEERQT